MFVICLLNLIFSSQLEKAFLEETDITKSISLLNTSKTGLDFLISYFIKKYILDQKTTKSELILDLVQIPDKKLFQLVHASKIMKSDEIYDTEQKLASLLISIGRRIRNKFIKQPYNFKPKTFYNSINDSGTMKYIKTMIYTGDKRATKIFLTKLDLKLIDKDKYIKEIEYLADKGNTRACGHLGEAYFYGVGKQKSMDKAMQYYLKGKKGNDALSLKGIGKILMSDEYLDFVNAKHHLDASSLYESINETDYLLYLIYKNHFKMENLSRRYLSKSVSLGYLPALYQEGINYYKKGDINSSLVRLKPILEFDEFIINFQDLANQAYSNKNYKKSLLYLLLTIEMGAESSISNAIYLLEKFKPLDKLKRFNLFNWKNEDSASKNKKELNNSKDANINKDVEDSHLKSTKDLEVEKDANFKNDNYNITEENNFDTTNETNLCITIPNLNSLILLKLYQQNPLSYLNKIGDCYFYGNGISQSYQSAAAYYMLSASKLEAEGLVNISYMYEKGLGVEKDIFKAYKYLKKLSVDDKTYLLVYYANLCFIFRLVVLNVYFVVSLITGVISYKVYNKTK